MTAPRSLADDLRRRDDAALARLLQLRPDLLHPVPADFTALTSRATAAPSVSRCLDSLDALDLFVLSVIAGETKDHPAPRGALVARSAAALGADAHDGCNEALANLIDRALVWGDDDGLRAIASVADLVAGSPAPSWPAPGSPLMGPLRTLRDPGTSSIETRPIDEIDRAAGLHARESLSLVRDLLDEWSAQPPGVLRTGGLSLKDFAAARAHLHCDYARAALAIDLAHTARLVADDEEEEPRWVPTDRFDTWVDADPAEAWLALVDAWLHLPRLPSRATAKTKVLVDTDDRRAVPVLRREVLQALTDLPEGAGLDEAELVAVLDYQRPRRAGDLRIQVVAATLREGSDLGILSGGALSSAGRRALAQHANDPMSRRERMQQVSDALASSMPDEVDHLLIGADLTLVAPGPLAPAIARRVGSMADIESRGHATVYRISESSVRRALDAGWDAEGVLAFLAGLSRTPVPQPLAYLVEDVARRHGAVRVGPALSYLRSDAPQTLATMVKDRRLRTLGLRRIADTVLICSAPTSEVLTTLRDAGYAPAAEGPDGGIVIRRPEDHRVRAPRAAAPVSSRSPEPALVNAAVKTIRAGDRASGPRGTVTAGPAGSTAVPSLPSSAVVARLREAIAETMPLWIGYADTDGTVVDQIVDPIRLAGGVLTAFDHRTDGVRTFAVSRITGVAVPE